MFLPGEPITGLSLKNTNKIRVGSGPWALHLYQVLGPMKVPNIFINANIYRFMTAINSQAKKYICSGEGGKNCY